MVNDSESNNFDLVPTAAFDEVGIATCSCFSPDKFRIDFFVMDDSTHYFIRHIYFYQGNNAGNINIHTRAINIPTTVKAVVNGIVEAGVGNDPDGARKLFSDNCYACPEILAILED